MMFSSTRNMPVKKRKAVLLFSGGLDSLLAAHLMVRSGVELLPLYCHTIFSQSSRAAAVQKINRLLYPLRAVPEIVDISALHLQAVKTPLHGRGSNYNPCVDCKVIMFRAAREYMIKTGASFIVTGDVLGQRPMSQRKGMLQFIDRQSAVEGLVLRPLSARCLPPTAVEVNSWIKRDALYDITGRSRLAQRTLAEQFGITDYTAPAGGCLLTEPSFCSRIADLFTYEPDFGLQEISQLKVGRHFRLSRRARLIVARNIDECRLLAASGNRTASVFIPYNCCGPWALGVGCFNPDEVQLGAQIVSRYCKKSTSPRDFVVCKEEDNMLIRVAPPAAGQEVRMPQPI